MTRYKVLWILCVALSVGAVGSAGAGTPVELHTWSIITADPQTGAVGVALASCVPVPADAVPALVPGKGVGVAQALFDLHNRNRLFELIQAGKPAPEIITELTSPASDPGAATRQYGIITLANGTAQLAGYTGARNMSWAGDIQDVNAVVSVQGNLLVGEAVVKNALDAFKTRAAPLSDRLMFALEAGSAAGGDRRCDAQTASTALLIMAKGDQPPFVVPQFGQSLVGQPNTPWLYLSITEPIGGKNAVSALREQYNVWRAKNLLCAECPPQGESSRVEMPFPIQTLWTQYGIALLFCALIPIALVVGSIWFVRHRRVT